MGNNQLTVKIYFPDSSYQNITRKTLIVSDIVPKKLEYKITGTFPHDKKAFTQGLAWKNGFLYEGTGKKGASSLRKISPQSGEVIQSLNLPNSVFGEGICIFDDRIYQLTWRSQKGYIYDLSDFSKIREFKYYTEGWGLSSNGKNLIMSDGSNKLYFLDPEYLNENRQIGVYNHQGAVDKLNELEYVNHTLFANVYQKSHIVQIDPETGKVLATLDLSDLVPKNLRGDRERVLNGIAWQPDQNIFWVTGKMWPKMYALEITNLSFSEE